MNYGFVFPGGEARDAATTAHIAEDSGWDGFFVWEPVWGIDAWVSLAAVAVQTERIRLGTMITPDLALPSVEAGRRDGHGRSSI